jgi:hypothetical protein
MALVRTQARSTDLADLPPSFRLVRLREAGDAFARAQAIAATAGAGTLVQVGRFDPAEFAVVLEPDEPLRTARWALYVGLTALGDALASLAPPEKPIRFDWPAAVRLDGGLVGGARLAWPAGGGEDETPDWLVFGAMIRTAPERMIEPGLEPFATTLRDEGFEEEGASSRRLIEGFTRHLMAGFDLHSERGQDTVKARYLGRLAPPDAGVLDLDADGDLLRLSATGSVLETLSLRAALAEPAWFDPERRGPRR